MYTTKTRSKNSQRYFTHDLIWDNKPTNLKRPIPFSLHPWFRLALVHKVIPLRWFSPKTLNVHNSTLLQRAMTRALLTSEKVNTEFFHNFVRFSMRNPLFLSLAQEIITDPSRAIFPLFPFLFSRRNEVSNLVSLSSLPFLLVFIFLISLCRLYVRWNTWSFPFLQS